MTKYFIRCTFQYGAQGTIDALENHLKIVRKWTCGRNHVNVKDFVSIGPGVPFENNFSITYDFRVEADSFEQAISRFRYVAKTGTIVSVNNQEVG